MSKWMNTIVVIDVKGVWMRLVARWDFHWYQRSKRQGWKWWYEWCWSSRCCVRNGTKEASEIEIAKAKEAEDIINANDEFGSDKDDS